MQTVKSRGAILMMLACAALWSIAGLFIKAIPWNPLVIAGVRSLIASGVVLLYMRTRGMRPRFGRGALISGIMLCLTFMAFVTANKMTTSANTIVLQYSAPVFIMVISAMAFRQRFRRADYWVVAVTVLGIALCFLDKMNAGGMLGNIIAVFSGLFLAGMYVATGHTDETQRMSGILLGHLFTAAIGLPMMLIFPTPITGAALINVAILGVFQLGIPYVLYGIAAGRCSPLAACLVGVAEPLLNPLWVFLFDGEAPGLMALLGGAVVIAAVTVWCIRDAKK
jgi:drug/metabolite transporter (DMT)-like permease